MSADNALVIGLGVVGGILMLAALNNKKEAAQQIPQQEEKPKTPDQIQAERVAGLLREGHYTEAVNVSCKVLFGLIRRKSGVPTLLEAISSKRTWHRASVCGGGDARCAGN